MTKATPIHPLPAFLGERYRHWRDHGYAQDQQLYRDLVTHGQHPPAMVISCCDSRVHSMVLFGGQSGDFFIHRNIANLVPPHDGGDTAQGTGAALEYAVTALKVKHILVMGHSGCGGIENGYHHCSGTPGRSLAATGYIGGWLDQLQPALAALPQEGSAEDRIAALEKQSVVTSLGNLMGYAFVAAAVAEGSLSLHGLWHDIASGMLMAYDPETEAFAAV